MITKLIGKHLKQDLSKCLTKRIKRCIGAFFLFMFIGNTGFLFAQTLKTLTWKEILAETKEKNPQLNSAVQSLKSANLSYKSAFTGFLPQLSANAGWSKSGTTTGLESITEDSNENEEFNYGLSGNLSVFSGFKNSNMVKIQKAEFEKESSNFNRTISDVAYNLRIGFGQVLRAQEMILLSEDILNRRKENTQIVKLKYEAGKEDKGAYFQSDADFYQAEYDDASANRNLKITQFNLMKEMGRDEFEVITLKGNLDTPLPEKISSMQGLVTETPRIFIGKICSRLFTLQIKIHSRRFLSPHFSFRRHFEIRHFLAP